MCAMMRVSVDGRELLILFRRTIWTTSAEACSDPIDRIDEKLDTLIPINRTCRMT